MSTPVPPHSPQPGSQQPGAQHAPQTPPAQQGPYPTPQAPRYQTPAYGAQPTTMAGTNAFAVVAVILCFLQPIAGIVFGHIALGQIKRGGDAGRGLALTGLIIGYVTTAMWIFFWIFYISVIGALLAGIGSLANPAYS